MPTIAGRAAGRMRALVLTAATALAVAVVAAPTANAAEPVIVTASEDSYVNASLPTSNYGSRLYMIVDGDPQQVAYLKFAIPSGTSLTGGVKLRIFAESSHRAGVASYAVTDSSWTEAGLTYENRPAPGAASGGSGTLTAGTWSEIDVSSAVTSTGTVSLALQPLSTTAAKLTSSEGTNKPQLVIGGTTTPPPPPADEFTVSPVGAGQYQAVSATTTYTGSLKSVGERAVADLKALGGGTVQFTAGRFDFGAEYFKFTNMVDIDFVGAGMGATEIVNSSDAAADTEPFNITGTNRVTIRDMTIVAGGAARSTSDAIDFDRGNNSVVDNVAITQSRARGIVFDGKDSGATAEGNTVRNCRISGTRGVGIEFLASSNNTVTGCTITGTGGHGIYANKSGSTAAQPNKKSNGNTISGNRIDEAGYDGVSINGGDRNQVLNNNITNSSNRVTSRDGIRVSTNTSTVGCDDNVVSGNTATDTQTTKTQTYGLNIASSLCNRTVVGPGNNFAGNRLGPFRNLGTATDIRQTF